MKTRMILSKRESMGFSLMELMVTVAIVAVLATIAYPSYRQQVLKSRRTEATGVLDRRFGATAFARRMPR